MHRTLPVHQHVELFFNQVLFPTNIPYLLQQIHNGTAVAVTDASVFQASNIGASSFIITTSDLKSACTGSHGVPRGSECTDSYCEELYGIFSIISTLTKICQKHKLQTGSIIIASDNKASIGNSLYYDNRTAIKHSSYDILWDIQNLKKDLPIQLIPQHLKGHQDQLGRELSLLVPCRGMF